MYFMGLDKIEKKKRETEAISNEARLKLTRLMCSATIWMGRQRQSGREAQRRGTGMIVALLLSRKRARVILIDAADTQMPVLIVAWAVS